MHLVAVLGASCVGHDCREQEQRERNGQCKVESVGKGGVGRVHDIVNDRSDGLTALAAQALGFGAYGTAGDVSDYF